MAKKDKNHFSFKQFREVMGNNVALEQEKRALELQIEAEKERKKKELEEQDNTLKPTNSNAPAKQAQQNPTPTWPANAYSTISPQEYNSKTADPYAFYDAISPDPTSPEYAAWAERTNQRVKKDKTGTAQLFPATKAAQGYLDNELQKILDSKKHESTVERLNRRLLENRTFGKLNKNKALTDKEYLEIHNYRLMNDPDYLKAALEDFDKQYQMQQKAAEKKASDLEKIKPDNYYGQDISGDTYNTIGVQGTGGMYNTTMSFLGIVNSAYGKSFASDFIIKTNESQAQISTGKISRAKELQGLADDVNKYLTLTEKYANNLAEIQKLQLATGYGSHDAQLDSGVLHITKTKLNLLLEENQKIRQTLNEHQEWRNSLNNLSTWSAGGPMGFISQAIDSKLDLDIGGIRNYLNGLGGMADDLAKKMQSREYNQGWLDSTNRSIKKIRTLLNNFNAAAEDRIKGWQDDYTTDLKDIQDWVTGDNILKARAKVDDYYKAEAEALQYSQYSWKNPIKMAAFGWSGIAGGSNSSWWKSAISTGSALVGGTYGFGKLVGAKLLTQATTIGIGYNAQKAASNEENNIEAGTLVTDQMRSFLINNNLYDEFIKEGLSRMSKFGEIKDLQKLGDKEQTEQRILEMYCNGMWHSTNPEITMLHRDAVVGTNNLFYANEPVNSTDALVGTLATTLRLEPIEKLALGSKVVAAGRLARMKFGKTAAGLKFAGFKEGVHGAAKKALESEAGRALTTGLIKAKNGAAKVGHALSAPLRYTEKGAKWIGRESGIARAFNRVRQFATTVPSRYLKAAAITKGVANVGMRMGINTASEMTQEGVQGFNAQKAKDSDWGYDQQSNVGLAKRAFDDIITGGKAVWYWINQNDPAYYTDSDVVPSMNATPLLTLFGLQPSISLMTSASKVRSDVKAIDIIQNNLDILKRTTDTQLIQGELLAKLAMMEDKQTTRQRFIDFARIVSAHDRATDIENAYRRARGEALLEEDEDAIPRELIDDQYKTYEDIYDLAHSEQMYVIAQRAGINPHAFYKSGSSQRNYAKLVSLLNYRLNSRNESYQQLMETDAEIQKMFGTHIEPDDNYYEDDVDQNVSRDTKEDDAKALASLYALYQLYDDYSKLEHQMGKEHSLSNHFKMQSNMLKKALEKHGIRVENKEDVLKALDNTEVGNTLIQLLQPALQSQGIDISNFTIRDLLDGNIREDVDYNDVYMSNGDNQFDGIAKLYRQRHMQEYDALLQQHMLNDLMQMPNHQLKMYDNKLQTDKNINRILEEDYVNSIRRIEDAAVREVKDNDIFVGNDGHWYITHRKKQKDGTETWTKRRYHPNSGKIDSEDLQFSKMEYHDSLTERETARERNKQTQNTKSSTATTSEQTANETQDQNTDNLAYIGEHAQPQIEQQSPDTQETQKSSGKTADQKPTSSTNQLDGKTVRFIYNGEQYVGKVVGQSTEKNGYVLIQTADGNKYSVNTADISLLASDATDNTPKYKTGDKVIYGGQVYEILYIQGADGNFVYDLERRDGENVDVLSAGEDQLQQYVDQTEQPVEQPKKTRVTPNQQQQEVLDKLKQKQEEDKSLVKSDKDGNKVVTAFNYFIKVGRVFMSFIRVHGIIGPQFVGDISRGVDQKIVEQRLRKSQDIENEIRALQNEYNQNLADTYGKDSFEYKRYSVNLEMYTKRQMLSNSEIDNTIHAISEIVTNKVPGPAVIAGQIVDEIGRAFFAGEQLTNKPEYKMTDAIFKDTVKEFEKIQAEFVKRGWVVDTTPYTWYFTLPNRQRVAGETDLIAIDREGHIHVLDFKTTKNSRRFKPTRQFKSKNPITGEEVWQNIQDGMEAPEGAEVRTQLPFFDENLGAGYQRNYAQQYARQLHMYRLMIQEQTGVKVTSLEILPFYVDYDNVGNDVDHMSIVQSQGVVNLNGTIVEDEFSALDNYLQSDDSATNHREYYQKCCDDLQSSIQQYQDILDYVDVYHWVSVDLENKIRDFIKLANQFINHINNLVSDDSHASILQEYDLLKQNIVSIDKQFDQELEEYKSSTDNSPSPDSLNDQDKHSLDKNWEDSQTEIVPEAGKQHWYQFNNLHSTIDFLKTIPHYLESIIKSDFIVNSQFKIYRNDDGTFNVTITYAPKGSKVIKFSKSMRIRLGNELGNEPGSNSDVQSDPSNYSIMARNLIRQYRSLFNSLKPGEYIVAKNVKRTNGQLVYSENDHSLMDTQFIVGESTLTKLLNGEDSLLGVVGKNGEIFEISDTNRSTIGDTNKLDENGKPLPKGYTPLPGNELTQDEHMPAGSVVFLYKFKYDEDPVDAPMRVVYITLRGKKFETNDVDLIVNCLQQIASANDQNTDTIFNGIHIYDDKGEVSNEMSRISCQQILKMITRFGRQASFAGHDFIFQYAVGADQKTQNRSRILITDMEQTPVVDRKTKLLTRPTVTLDITDAGDLARLRRILALVDMHINQAGIMRSKLNDQNGFFGSVCRIFENTDYNITRIKFGDFEITRDDYEQGLDFAGWMIKHGYARTNAESLQNPLISITELEKTSNEAEKKKAEDDAKPASDGGQVGVQQETKVEEKPVIKPEPKPEKSQEQQTKEGEQTEQEPNKRKIDDGWDDASIDQALDDASNGSSWADGNLFDDGAPGMLMVTDQLANSRLTEEQQRFVEKETKRLVGNVPLIFVEHELSTLSNGARVAGMISTDTITLSKHAPEGAQYHEAFHRILELLVGEKRRKKIYQRYAEHYGAAFEKSHGRKLTERDVAEGLAEMFRMFMIDREHISIKWNNFWKISKIFNEIKEYIQALRALGDRKFAMLFIMANSGIFRHIKPKQANIERFVNDFNGQMYLTISGKRYHTDEDGKRKSERVHIDLSEFPAFGGMQMFEEALDHIVSTIIQGYSIDMTASNAARIVTDLSSMQKLFHGKESTEHSAFFRVLTGEYINDENGMTVQDAIQYYKTNYGSQEIAELTRQAAAKVEKGDINGLKKQILVLIREQENKRKFEDLNQSQKMFAQLFDKNNWDIIEQKINRRLQVLGIDSQLDRLQKQEDDENDVADDENSSYIGQEIAAHDDAFYTHDRSEDTTAAVRFMLSTIPDERFATEEDVKVGRVKSTVNKDGSRVMIPNNRGILGFTGYVPRNQVKNLLLSACHDCKSAEDLLQKLHELAETEPVFYRLERKLNALLNNSIKKHDDGKYILIGKDGEPLKKNSYFQHNGEDGIYFTSADKDGKDSGNIISEYDYDVDSTSSEALATQLFNFVSCQKLDFMQVVFSQVHDEDGQPVDGKYTSNIKSSDSGYAASMFPKQWFAQFRTGVSGIFFMNKNGNIKFVKNGEQETGRVLLKQAQDTLGEIYKLYTTVAKTHKIGERDVDKNSKDDFIYIEQQFINSLNILGIDIQKPALEMALREHFDTIGNGISIQKAFGYLITSAKQDLSFQKFIESVVWNKNENSLCQTLLKGNQEKINDILMTGKKEVIEGRSREFASGTNIYSDNSFIKWCAQAVSRYNKTSTDLMTNGPEGTKNYTMAQRHTAYDMTEDINEGGYDKKNDSFTGSKILKDSSKWNYCWSTRKVAGRIQRIGSLIMKYIATGDKFKLKLQTYNGARLDSDYQGGVKYTKTSEREDFVGKCGMLAAGRIVFPTLSDKSTWFFLDGIKTPGIDYHNITNTQTSDLLHVTEVGGELHISVNPYDLQIRQMIEYAFCERNAIAREIERNEEKDKSILNILKKIERVSDNRMRFGSLTKIAYRKDDGSIGWLHLTGDKDPLYYLQKADDLFFGDHVTDKQRAEMMTLTLEEGFYDDLALAEHCGAIVNDNEGVEKLGRLYTYKNVAFDSVCIDKLQAKYEAELTPSGSNITIENAAKARSQAVLAYMWDVYLRGIISEEEVERLYTGNPISYKWVYGIVNGVKRLVDRHSDQTKRLGGLGSTGERNRPYMVGIRSKYKCAEVEDQMVVSNQLDMLNSLFPDAEIRQIYYEYKSKDIVDQDKLDELADRIYGKNGVNEMTLDEIKKDFESAGQITLFNAAKKRGEDEASSFGLDKKGRAQINVADGAAFITPKMAKNLLRQLGKYTQPVREAFEYLEGKRKSNILSNKQAFKTIYEAMLGTQKYSAYGYRMVGDVKIQYYNKFALFPLFKQMASGYTQQILSKMESQHIDMLMMHSAVKIGSQSPAELTEKLLNDKEAFDAFQFDTYDQEYKFIRKQLNTDPHEKQFAQMGTQMTKVALTSLIQNKEYTTPDGKTLRGRDLLREIMREINNLSTYGMEELEREMFDDSGELDIEKFSRFLEEELESRDADENLIDGIQVEVDNDGKKHFKVNLEAMSSIDWIQSILVAKLNKKIVDINVKGNAFYQRSVWGMEGKPTILGDDQLSPTINDGNELKLVNEDGSMDAVISIDFFMDIIPEGLKNDFEASRKWLIKNKIIGKDAKANTIASRIPTQAQSSIHALRFVDVLPIVRDTIVLPKEFTMVTGSDFDIDKLYLSRLSYRSYKIEVESNGKKITIDKVSTDFKKDSEDKSRNNLLNYYLTILKDHGKDLGKNGIVNGASASISLRSIDSDTNLVKNVLAKIETNKQAQEEYAYKFGNIAFQVRTRGSFVVGKFGIGPFALNNNSQILTQLYGVKFDADHCPLLRELGCLDLSSLKDKQGNLKLSWLSGLINAHVDVAKDPYIQRLNINTFTYNTTNLLVRTGMGERTFMFLSQPIMKELASVYETAGGNYMEDVTISKAARQRFAVTNYILDNFKDAANTGNLKNIKKTLQDIGNNNTDLEESIASFAKALFGINDDGSYSNEFEYIQDNGEIITKSGCILEDIFNNKDVLHNINKELSFDNLEDKISRYRINVKVQNDDGQLVDTTIDLSPKQVQLYVAYINQEMSKYGQKLSDLVNACKIDTKKQGKSYVEQQAFKSKYNDVFDNDDRLFEQYGLNRLKNESFIGEKTNNALSLYERIISQISMQGTEQYRDMHSDLMAKFHSSEQNKELSKKVSRCMMKVVKQLIFDDDIVPDYAEDRGMTAMDYAESLFFGDNTIQDQLLKIQNKIRNDKKGSFASYGVNGTIINPLLKALQADVYQEREGYANPKFIKLENAVLDDSDNANAIERAWDELYHDEEHYIEYGEQKITFKQFAENLFVYAFYTSGDTTGGTKFFKYAPNTIRIDSGYNDLMANAQDDFKNGTYPMDSDEMYAMICYNNWTDPQIVREFRTKRYKSWQASFYTQAISTKKILVQKQRKSGGKPSFITRSKSKTVNLLMACVKTNPKDGKRISTIKPFMNEKTGMQEFPLFIKVRQRGFDKYDPDNFILYRLVDTKPLNTASAGEGVYPIYAITIPNSTTLRAGSYNYDYIRPQYTRPVMYDDTTVEAINKFFSGKHLMSDKPFTEDTLIDNFANLINNSPVLFTETELIKRLGDEFKYNELDITQTKLQKIISKYIDEDHRIKLRSDEKSKGKSTEKSDKKTNDKVVNVHYGNDQHRELSNLSERKFTATIDGLGKFEFNSVEGAIQATKLLYTDEGKYIKEKDASGNITLTDEGQELFNKLQKVSDESAIQARKDGKNIEDLNVDKWSDDYNELLAKYMTESFQQNEEAKKALLDTGDKTISHENSKGVEQQGGVLSKILTKIRKDLNKAKSEVKEESLDEFKSRAKDIEIKDERIKELQKEQLSAKDFAEKVKQLYYDAIKRSPKDIYSDFKAKLESLEKSENLQNDEDEILHYMQALIDKYSKSEKESSEKKGKSDTSLDDDFDVDDIEEVKPIDLSHKGAEQFGNTYNRPFTKNGIQYDNVIQANYCEAVMNSSMIPQDAKDKILNELHSSSAYTVMRQTLNDTRAQYGDESVRVTADMMIDNMKESFKQNPKILKRLLNTGNAKIIRKGNEDGVTKSLMIARSELQNEKEESKSNDKFDDAARKHCKG